MVLLAISMMAVAQRYITAVGIRAGHGLGLSVQQQVLGSITVEGIMHQRFSDGRTMLTAMAQKHNGLLGKRLNFYVGGGPYIAYPGQAQKLAGMDKDAGLSLIGGLEFTAGRTVLSMDYLPQVSITGNAPTLQAHSGLSLRYVIFESQKRKPKNKKQGLGLFKKKGQQPTKRQ